MKTLYFKTFFLAFATILGLSITSCGGSSSTGSTGMAGNMSSNTSGDLPYPTVEMNYDQFYEGMNTSRNDLVSLIGKNPNLSTFAALAKMANMDTKLGYTGDVTIFAPTNEAFKQMPLEQFKMLTNPNNKAQLARFVQRHVLPSKVNAIDFNSSQAITTAADEEITVDTEMNGNVIYVGGAQVIKSDIDAKNGVIHIVNSIIEPTNDVFTE